MAPSRKSSGGAPAAGARRRRSKGGNLEDANANANASATRGKASQKASPGSNPGVRATQIRRSSRHAEMARALKMEEGDEDTLRRNRTLHPKFALGLVDGCHGDGDAGADAGADPIEDDGMDVDEVHVSKRGAILEEEEEDALAHGKENQARVAGSRGGVASTKSDSKDAAMVVDDENDYEDEDNAVDMSVTALDREQYYPIALPLKQLNGEDGNGEAAAASTTRMDMNGTNPMNGSEKLASPGDGMDGMDGVPENFTVFQFPCELPDLPSSSIPSGKLAAKGGSSAPERIGKLVTYSDGTSEMLLGDVRLEVCRGTHQGCRHEVAIVSTVENECIFLGTVTDKRVCTPTVADQSDQEHNALGENPN